jgi:hypothetical protein
MGDDDDDVENESAASEDEEEMVEADSCHGESVARGWTCEIIPKADTDRIRCDDSCKIPTQTIAAINRDDDDFPFLYIVMLVCLFKRGEEGEDVGSIMIGMTFLPCDERGTLQIVTNERRCRNAESETRFPFSISFEEIGNDKSERVVDTEITQGHFSFFFFFSKRKQSKRRRPTVGIVNVVVVCR